MIQKPVAGLRIRGGWALNLELGSIERPQYSCNFDKCVKEQCALANVKLTKKFAPEIEVPAQKNQNCALCLAVTAEFGADAVRRAMCSCREQRESLS